MRYPSGEPAHVGDLIELFPGHPARIVCSLDDREWSDDFRARDWAWLERGVLVRTACDHLIHVRRLHGSRLLRAVGR